MSKSSLSISDNFLSEDEYKQVIDYCVNAKYTYGEVDTTETPPTGMVSEILPEEKIYDLFSSKIENKYEQLSKDKIYRMYVNCFSPNENPYFHTDGETGVTALFYPTIEWNLNEGGETQFLTDENIIGILPIPNRIVFFDANIPHKATSFRSNYRFTIAVKYR